VIAVDKYIRYTSHLFIPVAVIVGLQCNTLRYMPTLLADIHYCNDLERHIRVAYLLGNWIDLDKT